MSIFLHVDHYVRRSFPSLNKVLTNILSLRVVLSVREFIS